LISDELEKMGLKQSKNPCPQTTGSIDAADPTASISITRSDGKVLSFDVTDTAFAVQTRENVIRWSSDPEIVGSDGPFK
jgi:hypothetical protein